MVRHIVMWKLKEVEKTENALKIKRKLEDLKEVIKEIHSIEVNFNSDKAPQSNFDVILDVRLGSFQDLDIYQDNPAHLEVVQFVKSVIEQRVAIDYEY